MTIPFLTQANERTKSWFGARTRTSVAFHVFAQCFPVVVFFYFVFGSWSNELKFLLGICFIFSAIRGLFLLSAKRFRYLLRPVLTMVCVAAYLRVGDYSAERAVPIIREIAQEMQDQCVANGRCGLPRGTWAPIGDGERYVRTMSGWIPIGIRLTLYANSHMAARCSDSGSASSADMAKSAGCLPADSFLVQLPWEDGYTASGGVKATLEIPPSHWESSRRNRS